MWIRQVFLVVIGLASGSGIACGLFALIVKLGILPRLAQWTKTARDMKVYEDCILLGGTVGCIVTLFEFPMPAGVVGVVVPGLFFGIYTGCFYMALAEALHAVPVLMRRLKIKKGAGSILLCMALGKAIGSLLYFWLELGKR